MDKISFNGTIISIQPRIRLTRSFDESSHNYLGYAVIISGWVNGRDEYSKQLNEHPVSQKNISIGIGQAAHEKHQFKVGDEITGECVPVVDQDLEPVEFYKVSKLKKSQSSVIQENEVPPWQGVPPDLDTYKWRGHRRLASRTYDNKCFTCIWGCRMPVEIIIDNWNPNRRKYRIETFCYGPLNCKLYKAGPNRKVEGRKGMVYVEEDWVDQEMTSHRELDEE